MPPFDNSQYFQGPFTGGGYFPVDETSMTEADARGRARAQAPAAGQQKAEDMAKEVERRAAEELDRKRMERLNLLVDSYRNPTSYDPNVGEEEIKRRAEMNGISVTEAKNIAYNERARAEGRAENFIDRTNAYKKELQPLPTYSLGKDYFGRDIMTNRPASTAQEQAKRIAAYNQAPGSLTQFALASPEQKSELATDSAKQMLNQSLANREQRGQAAENGFAWDSATGRYTRSNELTSSQRASMRERLKLGPSFTFGQGKATETPTPSTPPATVTPKSVPLASNEPTTPPIVQPQVAEDVVQPYTEAQKQPVLPVQAPTVAATPAAPSLKNFNFYSAKDEVNKLLGLAGINPDITQPTAPKFGGSRRGYTAEDQTRDALAQTRAELAKAEAEFKRFSTTRFGRDQKIDKNAARKAAETIVTLKRRLPPQGVEGIGQDMYTGRKD